MTNQLTCTNCGQPIRATTDPDCPLIHTHSTNAFCDVSSPADAFTNAKLTNRTEASL